MDYKPNFPLIIVYARDWNLYKDEYDENFNFKVGSGWISGFLIKENEDSLVVAAEHFDKEENVRYTQVIPKETILFKKIIEV